LNNQNTINRCQPGFNASCSLCCGSHNYDKPLNLIKDIFSKRAIELEDSQPKYQETFCFKKLFDEELQCPNLGELPDNPGLIGCLIHSYTDLEADTKYFFDGTCKIFLCDAWDNLTDRQVSFAAELMGDWYYYSLFIKDIESVHEICALYNSPEDVPAEELELLKDELHERYLEEGGNF
jgi:hypothetical protein